MDASEARQDTKDLFEEYVRTGDVELRNKIVEQNLYLVKILISKFTGKGIDYDDLLQVGSLALLNAVERFDPSRGYEFSTFATPTIIGELKRHFRDKSWAVKIPRRIKELAIKLPSARDELQMSLGRPPRIAEIADYLGYTEEEVLEALENSHAHSAVSLDQQVTEGAGDEAAEATLADMTGEEDSGYASFENADLIENLMGSLSDDEKYLFRERMLKGRTQKEMAEELGISQMTVSRMENALKAKFRKEYYKE